MSLAASLGSRQMVQARSSVRAAPCRRFAVVVRAEKQDDGLSFTQNTRAAEGYTDKDTAGQANMYPSVTKPFEAGSASDTVDSANLITAFGAAGLAVGAIVLGLGTLNVGLSAAPPTAVADGSYESLTSYSSKFSSELGMRTAAPAPPVAVEVVEAVEEAPSA